MFEETIVYKNGGMHQRKGGMFSYKGVKTQDEYDSALSDGWFATLDEAIAPKVEAIDEKSPATRTELEFKANELGIKFDGRTTDKKLAEQISAKV